MESDDDDDDDEKEICDDEEEPERDDTESNGMIEMEAMDCEQNEESENETEQSDQDQSDSESVNIDLDVTADATTKPRKRIISMDDDSDDEQPKITNGKIWIKNVKIFILLLYNISVETSTAVDAEDDNQIAHDISETAENHSTNQALDESFRTINSHELSALESEILQLDNEINIGLNKSETSKLFQDSNEDDEIGESQLMALCSGAFVTQNPENVCHALIYIEWQSFILFHRWSFFL